MRDFFKPWRRKIGVVTLVMACVFMIGWIRSNQVVDVAVANTGIRTIEIWSFDGVVQPRFSYQTPGSTIQVGKKGCYFRSIDNVHVEDPDDHQLLKTVNGKPEWLTTFGGLAIGSKYDGFGWRNYFAVFPYWSIVIPLTLLSAYLLLCNPRPATEMKTSEPAQTEAP